MLNSEKIKPIAVVIIELHLSEGISQLLTDAFQNFFFKIPWQLAESVSDQTETFFGLSFT